jgi:glycosyltransferase involved in cell wall biosynthesis
MAATARQFRPDVAHVHNTWFALSPAVFHALHDTGVPTVMTLHNYRLICANAALFRDGMACTDCLGRGPWQAVAHRCYRGSLLASALAATTISLARHRRSFDTVDRFLVHSRFVRDLFVRAGFPPERLTIKANVVADPGPRSAPPSASRMVLYAGRLAPEKGVALLVEGWIRSGLASKGLRLVVAGEGPLRAELEARAVPGVEFPGWVPAADLRRQMLQARALVFPSQWYETFGTVIVEAMASGVPVLASDVATPAEIVGALGPGWLVPLDDAEAWGAALVALADDEVVDAIGANARALYEDRYTPAHGLRALVDAYSSMRDRQGRACASF